MKRVVLGIVLSVALSGVCFAQEPVAPEDGLLNDPSQSVGLARSVINRINPSYETVWDVWNGDFYQGVSGSIYTFRSRQLPIASARIGVSTGMALYAGASLDLPGLTQRFLPAAVKDPLTTSPLDAVWSFIGKYGRVGIVGGYSWDHEDPMLGLTAGAAFTF